MLFHVAQGAIAIGLFCVAANMMVVARLVWTNEIDARAGWYYLIISSVFIGALFGILAGGFRLAGMALGQTP